jgi:hypothetical protein
VNEIDERDGGEKPGGGKSKAGRPACRNNRLAAALRENLRRRKAQARARKAGAGPAGSAEPACERRLGPRRDPDPPDPDAA